MSACPTVRIAADNEGGFVVINEENFNPEIHTLYVEPDNEEISGDGTGTALPPISELPQVEQVAPAAVAEVVVPQAAPVVTPSWAAAPAAAPVTKKTDK